MVKRTSRYENANPFIATAQTQFRGLMPRSIATADGVLEYRILEGDRPDSLAQRFFNDDRLWWRIADSNVGFLFGADMTRPGSPDVLPDTIDRFGMAGATILIPKKD
jgi:hypothetical protein